MLFYALGINTKNLERLFDDILDWFNELNMSDTVSDFLDGLPEIMSKENPFCLWVQNTAKYGDHVFADADDKMTFLIYEEAKRRIEEKYPDAKIRYKLNGYYSSFIVDNDTYEKAYREARKDENIGENSISDSKVV